ncbi:MAG: OmpA family protein [Rickettsiales bacterium]|nr:OmpA family protein [Pseudomonadota bacterium]MDA0966305.1 OmpA family protein [Pseudomonadota bacterium]MDG4543030.1 OmpA family protein [Rickettsiales bacterium]MDG4545228.1 OmpA family protein [Rickettsiales bacterium]MDG4547677.1 OmpA family protein [Rickettsiales bacterium]
MNASKVIGTVLVAGMLSGCSMMGEKYSVYFDSGSAQISQADRAKLNEVANLAKEEDKKIKVIGYSDSIGSKQTNKIISMKRVESVSSELMKKGLAPEDIKTAARGEGWFDKEKEENREMRRVEIRVY